MIFDRIIERLRGDDESVLEESRKAGERSDQIAKRVDSQWAEVRRHSHFTMVTIRENHLAPKIHAAITTRRGDA